MSHILVSHTHILWVKLIYLIIILKIAFVEKILQQLDFVDPVEKGQPKRLLSIDVTNHYLSSVLCVLRWAKAYLLI